MATWSSLKNVSLVAISVNSNCLAKEKNAEKIVQSLIFFFMGKYFIQRSQELKYLIVQKYTYSEFIFFDRLRTVNK